MWQLFYLFSLHVVQSLFKPAHYDLIDSLGLSVPLWISWGGVFICYAQVTAISPEGLTIKLQFVVRDESTRNSESSDNILPNEFFGIHILDIHQWFRFNLLGEIIRADQ